MGGGGGSLIIASSDFCGGICAYVCVCVIPEAPLPARCTRVGRTMCVFALVVMCGGVHMWLWP